MMSTLNFCVNEIKDDVDAIEIMNGWVWVCKIKLNPDNNDRNEFLYSY